MKPLSRASARTLGSRVTAPTSDRVETFNQAWSHGDTTLRSPHSLPRSSHSLKRRVERIRRSGLLEVAPEIVVRQASTADELAQAYSLVHDVFVYQGYITPQHGGMRIRPFEALPEMITLTAQANGRVVAVLSIVPDSKELGLPSDYAYGDELDQLRKQGRHLAEVTNLALDPAYRNSGVFFELSRACAAHSLNGELDDLFISISPGHSIFFETILGFEPHGQRRSYSANHDDPVEGLRLDLRRFEQRVRQADKQLGRDAFLHRWFIGENPHFEAVRWSTELARQNFLKSDLLRKLFLTRTNYLNHCGDDIIEVLRQRWGSDILSAVLPSLDAPDACRELSVA